jgi:hypothetical protein
MAVSNARRKEIKSLYSYSLYDMDFKSVANDDWVNACYITVNCLSDDLEYRCGLIYQANKEALDAEFPEDQEGELPYKIHYGYHSIYLPLYGKGGFEKTMEFISFLEWYPILNAEIHSRMETEDFIDHFYDDHEFRLKPAIRNRLDCVNSGGLIDGCDISIDACLEKSHIASLALKSKFIDMGDVSSVTSCGLMSFGSTPPL